MGLALLRQRKSGVANAIFWGDDQESNEATENQAALRPPGALLKFRPDDRV